MDENLTSDPLILPAGTLISGRDVVSDPGLAQLRRYLPVLAVIAAPYAGMGGDQDPLNPLDRAAEWRALLRMVAAVTHAQTEVSTRLALARLDPPTSTRLGSALAVRGPDAFQVVHFVCHGERDMLYLEDENGHEAYAVSEHAVRLFSTSSTRLVFMDGCFSQRMAQLLIDETTVEAVAGTRRRVNPDNMLAFAVQFYTQITAGASVRTAYQAALAELEHKPDGQADRFELSARDDVHEIVLPLPEARSRASRPLVVESPVRLTGLPSLPGFAGRREELTALAEDFPASGVPLLSMHGPAGIGKSWLAAEFAARFAWRFPDGVLWFPCNAMTTSVEIVSEVARLLDMQGSQPPEMVLEALRDRRSLLVLDGVDAVGSWAELERIGAWVREIPPGSCAILTARNLSDLLPREGESRAHTVQPLAYKAARTLAMRLAVERDIEALDVDTIDDFLDTTRHWPWLIVHGVALVEAVGIQETLDNLAMLDPQAADPVSAFLTQRFQSLAAEQDNPLLMLVRAQGLADAFDEGLAQVLGGRPDQIGRLIQHGLLCRDGDWLALPDAARAFLHARSPLRPELQDQIDQEVMKYLARTWPYQGDAPILIDRTMRARLNNLRAAIQRQLRPDIGIDLRVLSRVLVVAARAFAAAGLGEEFLAYAQGFRERLPEGTDLARLQMAMGETLGELPDQEAEAGWAFQMSLRLDGLDTATRAHVSRALGRHLLRVDQVDAAEEFLSDSLRSLLAQVRRGDVSLAASLAHEWANALVLLGESADAVRRFEAALAGYAESQDAAQSAVAQRDLSNALIALGEMDRAEDVLRRALVTADYVVRRDLAEDIRRRLARVHVTRADAEHQAGQRSQERDELLAAEAYLSDALVDAQARGDSWAMASIHLDLGRILGRLGRQDDAVLHAVRGRNLYERSGSLLDRVSAAITAGQLHMLHGDSVTAQHILHEALDGAAALGDEGLIAQAAGVLLQIHQIRARHAPKAGRDFRQYTLDQASSTRARFIDLGLGEHADAVGEVILALTT